MLYGTTSNDGLVPLITACSYGKLSINNTANLPTFGPLEMNVSLAVQGRARGSHDTGPGSSRGAAARWTREDIARAQDVALAALHAPC